MTGLIDGGCFAGHELETGYECSIEQTLADFDRLGVERGLVGSYRCVYHDLLEGNREAAAWAARFPDRVEPLAILHPAWYGDGAEPLLTWLKRELGFRVVALLASPAYYPVDWRSPAVHAIGRAAERLGMALQAGIHDDVELGQVLAAWGDLDVPVMIRWMAGHRYKTVASEIAAAQRWPNVLFDIGNLTSVGAVAFMAERIGADRLFLASNAPYLLRECSHALLSAANLTEEARARIGGGTMQGAIGARSLRGRPALGQLPGADAEWLSRPKVDIHWHPDAWNLGEPALAPEEQFRAFDDYGFERVVLLSVTALNYDLERGNRLVEEWFARDDRLFGMIVVNPLQPERSMEQIERYGEHPRFVGIKTIQDNHGIGLDHPAYDPILRRAAELELPVLAHLTGLGAAAQRHPQTTFVGAHANWGRAARYAGQPNVYFDFSTGHSLRHETQLARFVAAVGNDRVLFGSDGPLISPAWSLAKLRAARLPAADEERILQENAYRLFPKLR